MWLSTCLDEIIKTKTENTENVFQLYIHFIQIDKINVFVIYHDSNYIRLNVFMQELYIMWNDDTSKHLLE